MEEELCATPEGAIRALWERSADRGNQTISIKIIGGYRFYRVHDVEKECL